MKILIGYYQRSGSTLLQHLLNSHSKIRAYSDANSFLVLPALLAGYKPEGNICVKPMDNFFLFRSPFLYSRFDKFIWLARDPRDSYLSSIEYGYAYGASLWFPGKKEHGVDIGLLQRWKKVYGQFFNKRDKWHLVKYEELISNPDYVLKDLFEYLELPYEKVYPFKKFNFWAGGDKKIIETRTFHKNSMQRYKKSFKRPQLKIFKKLIGKEMRALGYS